MKCLLNKMRKCLKDWQFLLWFYCTYFAGMICQCIIFICLLGLHHCCTISDYLVIYVCLSTAFPAAMHRFPFGIKNRAFITIIELNASGVFCHFWLVVCCFSIVGLISGSSVIPGSVHAFLGNILLYHLSYNGAWWVVPTYGFLILLSPAFIFAVKRANPLLMIIGSGSIYFVAYILYFNYELTITNKILEWMFEQLLLFGRSQFSFVVGIYFHHCNIIGRIHSIFKNELLRKGIIVILPVMVFVVHCFVQSLIIAPITGIVTLTSFHLWNKPVWIKKIFLFFGRHSTNIWLTHMFFYLILFTRLVYVFREPVAVYLFLLAICIFVSYGIDGIETLLHNGLYRLKIKIEGKR